LRGVSTATGHVLSLHRYPVKSLAGEEVDALRLDRRGAGGDRTHALIWTGTNRRLTIRQAPGMLAWRARYDLSGADLDPADPPLPVLTAPDGRELAWDDPELPAVLEADLGWPVTLRRDVSGQQDLDETVLVTVQASLEAVGAALDIPADLRRFRPNVHVALSAEAFAEEGWEGRRLRIGDVELQLIAPCERCVIPTRDPDTQERDPRVLLWLMREHRELFGINAEVPAPGAIRTGDPALLLPR
jgi:hypothetical protein